MTQARSGYSWTGWGRDKNDPRWAMMYIIPSSVVVMISHNEPLFLAFIDLVNSQKMTLFLRFHLAGNFYIGLLLSLILFLYTYVLCFDHEMFLSFITITFNLEDFLLWRLIKFTNYLQALLMALVHWNDQLFLERSWSLLYWAIFTVYILGFKSLAIRLIHAHGSFYSANLLWLFESTLVEGWNMAFLVLYWAILFGCGLRVPCISWAISATILFTVVRISEIKIEGIQSAQSLKPLLPHVMLEFSCSILHLDYSS